MEVHTHTPQSEMDTHHMIKPILGNVHSIYVVTITSSFPVSVILIIDKFVLGLYTSLLIIDNIGIFIIISRFIAVDVTLCNIDMG